VSLGRSNLIKFSDLGAMTPVVPGFSFHPGNCLLGMSGCPQSLCELEMFIRGPKPYLADLSKIELGKQRTVSVPISLARYFDLKAIENQSCS